MRTGRAVMVLTTVGLSLGACASSAEVCNRYGFEPGTNGFAQCMMQLDMNRASAMRAISASMLQQSQPTYMAPRLPVTTNCYRTGAYVNCTSQ